MRAALLLLAGLLCAAAQAAPPAGSGRQAALAQRVKALDRAVTSQRTATRQLHAQVHTLEQAQRDDAQRLRDQDHTIQALRRQLQAVRKQDGVQGAQGGDH